MRKALLTFLILFPATIWAQEPWNLEQCIQYALQNNLQIKQQELNVKTGKSNLLASKLDILPTLNASAYHTYTFGRAVNDQNSVSEDIANTSLSLNSSFNVFSGLLKYNTIRQNAVDLKASVSDVEKVKNNIALNISSAYLQVLYSEELVSSSNRQVELTKLQLERTSVLVKAGSLPEGNLLDIEAQLASDELQLVNSQNQLDIAYLNLAQILELKNVQDFKIQKPVLPEMDETIITESTSDIFQTAIATMPQITGATYRTESAKQGIKIAKTYNYPTLTISASYSTRAQNYLKDFYYDPTPYDGIDQQVLYKDPSYSSQFRDKASFGLGFNLSVPIFNGWQVRNKITSAKINFDRSLLTLETEKNTLLKDIQQAYTDALAAQKKFKASKKSVISLEEAFRYAEQKFNVGLVNSYDYTNAKTKLSKAETDLLQAKYELIFKIKILDFYKEIPLKL
ncbi:MAG: TolC family protein [Bacteroidales bacterium]